MQCQEVSIRRWRWWPKIDWSCSETFYNKSERSTCLFNRFCESSPLSLAILLHRSWSHSMLTSNHKVSILPTVSTASCRNVWIVLSSSYFLLQQTFSSRLSKTSWSETIGSARFTVIERDHYEKLYLAGRRLTGYRWPLFTIYTSSVVKQFAVVMDSRMMLCRVAIFTYLGLIGSVTCNKNHDVIKQVRVVY